MPQGLGYSFDPGAGQQGQLGQDGEGGGFSRMSPQQAVKLLSLRIPERPSGHGIAPQALLQSQGGMAAGAPPGPGSMNSIISGLMKMFAPGYQSGEAATGQGQMAAQGMPQGQAMNWGAIMQGAGGGNSQPLPRVIPGIEDGGPRSQPPPVAQPQAQPQQPIYQGPPQDWGGFMGQFGGGKSLF